MFISNCNIAPRKHHYGFALVATVSMMVLMTLIAVGMLSLSTIEQRSSGGSANEANRTARANARMALMIAMGELQKAAGPDQRVSATASILAEGNQPHLLGVWKSYKQANSDASAIGYESQKTGDFVQWLSSSSSVNQTDLSYHTQNPSNSIRLVGAGSVSNAAEYIDAPLQGVDTSITGDIRGSYAWHVMDESQKANLTLNNNAPSSDAERIAQLGTAGRPGFQIDSVYDNLKDLSDDSRQKLLTLNSSELVDFDPADDDSFHYLTTDSNSLLVDVANGGFQKDLSLLFENSSLPAVYSNRHIYSESNTPLVPAPARFAGAEPIPSPDPKWSQLQSHHQLYKKVTNSGGSYGVSASNTERSETSGFFDEQQILPVVQNAQFIYSLNVAGGFLYVASDTVVTLWNPYSVELSFNKMECEFHRFPLDIQYIINGSVRNPTYANIANIFSGGNLGGRKFGTQDTVPYRVRIHPLIAGTPIRLKAGEFKVFSNVSWQRTHSLGLYSYGVVLKEGWNPQGQGGVSSRFILAGDNGQHLGRTGGAWIRPQKNDVIKLRVKARHVNRAGTGNGETNNTETAALLKVFQGDGGHVPFSSKTEMEAILNSRRTHVGSIELDLPALTENLPNIGENELLQYVYNGNSAQHGQPWKGRKPFLNASLRLKTELDSDTVGGKPNAAQWIHNGVTNPYFSMGIAGDQDGIDPKAHQYELTWTPMTSWSDIPGVEINSLNRGYGGTGVTSGSGVNQLPYRQIPLTPLTSIAQFSHATLNAGGHAPLTDQIVGNSFAPTLVPRNKKSNAGSLGLHLDHSYMANTTLFDGYFLSTANSEQGAIYSTPRTLDTVLTEFFDADKPLANPNIIAVSKPAASVTAGDYDTFAQYLSNKGAFNVNSTSIKAWALFLASGTQEALPILNVLTSSTSLDQAETSGDTAFSRFAPMTGDEMPADVEADSHERFASHRRLTADQIKTLAGKVVDEVKARGPFQSVAEFVNRRLYDDGGTGNAGALQAAIEASGINTDFGVAAPKNHDELTGTPTGNTSDGAPSQITQGDILNRLAPSITVRGDTFRVRTYGDARDASGQVTAAAWCEAVVQRGHDFVDDTQPATTVVANLNTTNQIFGRRFNIVSFRWLSESEI